MTQATARNCSRQSVQPRRPTRSRRTLVSDSGPSPAASPVERVEQHVDAGMSQSSSASSSSRSRVDRPLAPAQLRRRCRRQRRVLAVASSVGLLAAVGCLHSVADQPLVAPVAGYNYQQQMPSVGMAAVQPEESGMWLLRQFAEHMNCQAADSQDVARWDGAHEVSVGYNRFSEQVQAQVQVQAAQESEDRAAFESSVRAQRWQFLQEVTGSLQELLVPFGTVDPVMSLECSLGTAALLQTWTRACLDTLGDRCLRRSIRVLQLAKLMTLFNFPDYGTMMSNSRWEANLQSILSTLGQWGWWCL